MFNYNPSAYTVNKYKSKSKKELSADIAELISKKKDNIHKYDLIKIYIKLLYV